MSLVLAFFISYQEVLCYVGFMEQMDSIPVFFRRILFFMATMCLKMSVSTNNDLTSRDCKYHFHLGFIFCAFTDNSNLFYTYWRDGQFSFS